MNAPLHLHVEVNPRSMLAAAFTPDRLQAAAAAFPGLLQGISISYGGGPADFDRHIATADALLLTGQADLTALEERAPRLRWLHYTSAGVEWLLGGHFPPGLAITNASGTHEPKAAEFSLLSVLMLNNRIPELMNAQQQRQWRQLPAPTVAGKTVVILGMGALGGAAAGALKPLGLRVIGVSRSGRPHPAADAVHRTAALHEILPQADFLLITLPLTPETDGLLDRAALDLLPRHAGVINIGRGPVLDAGALADKLREGSIGGAVLDALPVEPLPAQSPLWDVPNLIVTPHCGLYDPVGYGPRCLAMFCENLRRFRDGAPLAHVVESDRGY
jgi:phosphoglycerate dehydrogenase-like enzyme